MGWDSRTSLGVREDRFDIPGWSVGYHADISAHAAVRAPAGKGRNWLFVMTSPEDREPRSLDEEGLAASRLSGLPRRPFGDQAE